MTTKHPPRSPMALAWTMRTLIVVLVLLSNTIRAALADEAADAARVLSILWVATLDRNYQFVADEKAYVHRNTFVGDGKTYKMRYVFHEDKGHVDVCTEETPFRFLEEDPAPMFRSLYPPSSLIGVSCLFRRNCIKITCLNYDPIYNPQAEPRVSWPMPKDYSYGAVNPKDIDSVRKALGTLIRVNAAPTFDPDKPPQ